MRTDAHMHVNFEGFDLEQVIRYLDINKFDKCWLMTWEEVPPVGRSWEYKHLSVEEVYAAYQRYPDRIIPMYAPDPRRKDAREALIFWHDKGFKGCAELKTILTWDSEEMKEYLSIVSSLRIPVLFHMEEGIETVIPFESDGIMGHFLAKALRTNRLKGIPRRLLALVARACPPLNKWKIKRIRRGPGYLLDFLSLELTLRDFSNVNFIGHGPLFWQNLSITYSLLKHYSNLYADISGFSGYNALYKHRAFARRILSELPHKILFGTDNTQYGHEKLLNSLGLDCKVLEMIMGENAFRLIPS